ncbi:Endoglucanase-4 [Dactylellina cionopaga]|nr:Endoglucanase-4 [Dactylellina cionopaga]
MAQARAGSYVTFRWTRWQENHIGGIQTYLADCGGDSSFNGERYATEVLQLQGKSYTIQLPKTIKDGQYLMRHEMLAFMNSFKDQSLPTTQIYPTCVNIKLTGGTGEVVPDTVRLQDFYAKGAHGLPQEEISYGENFNLPGPPVTRGLGITPSEELNSGVNDNPNYDPFQEQLNEPSDDNDTVPNSHFDWFARNGITPPEPGEPVPSKKTLEDQARNRDQYYNQDSAPNIQSSDKQGSNYQAQQRRRRRQLRRSYSFRYSLRCLANRDRSTNGSATLVPDSANAAVF